MARVGFTFSFLSFREKTKLLDTVFGMGFSDCGGKEIASPGGVGCQWSAAGEVDGRKCSSGENQLENPETNRLQKNRPVRSFSLFATLISSCDSGVASRVYAGKNKVLKRTKKKKGKPHESIFLYILSKGLPVCLLKRK